ncbi:MAG TPA: ATP-binding protein [Actinophytocola sp.]|uniref:ATP-binding protein n=1 Tax=Actinophytocola sp. TaxID=1872138 RepID=UPI002DBD9F5C|nr:ATP-binding protein [Actinophytocola sp.]HEU5470780.1 ATP-binding protein [Actinophytocola sp.]
MTEPVGLVVGTEAASPLRFSVGIAPAQFLQLDDVVVTERALPDGTMVRVAGVVTNVEAGHEGARFASDVFLIEQGVLPAEVSEVAEVTVTRVEPEVYVPPRPGTPVHRASGEQRDGALYFDTMGEAKVPIGLGRDGQPVFLNFEFVDGTRGGHVSISGVSGIATKTSFATFLLHSIFNCGVLDREAHNTKALIFSVKGEDLLFLDYTNSRLRAGQRERYAKLGLPAAPFANVAVFAPPRPGDPSGTPDVRARDRAVSPFYWTLAEFCEQELMPFVFADGEDERSQYTMLIGQVAARLRRDAKRVGDDGAITVSGVEARNGGPLHTFAQLVGLIEDELGEDDTRRDWVAGSTSTGSVNAFLRRLRSAVRPLSTIIRADLRDRGDRSLTTARAQVTVVDLHNLPDRAQRFVVGVSLRQEFRRKESQGTARPLMFIVLDELNKYAPREGDSPIKQILLDVAERGRSLGVILIGAQQTASEVERRIVANCSIRVAGRLDPAEASRPEYGYLPPMQRQRATLAKPGTMFVAQPDIPVPLAIEFPFPAWATRPAETGEWTGVDTGPAMPADPFATIPGADDPPPF